MASANSKLLDLVNAENLPAKLLTDINVTFSAPAPTTEGGDTVVTITGVPGRGYRGSVDVTYQRVPLTLVAPTASLRSTNQFTQAAVVSMLNAMFGLFLTVDDFEDFTPPTLGLDESETLTLVAKAESKNFTGSIETTFFFGRTLLDSAIGARILGVLNHPIFPSMRSARMQTWNIDFTCIRDAILPVKGKYGDFEIVQACCAYYDIPAWVEGGITDQATSAVADSNKAFDRVIIQQNVNGGGAIKGDIYLHYNNLDEV